MVAIRQVSDPEALEARESELVRRARAGEMSAFRELYAEHFPVVSRMARRLGTPASEIEDVTQEVFQKAFQKLDRFHGGNFGFWIHRICANVVTDHHRRRRVRETLGRLWRTEVETTAESETVLDAPAPNAERFINKVLSHMRPKHREVFVLFELEKRPGEEIAERMGCPLNTVWTRLFHARKEFARIGQRYRTFDLEEGAA
jgi:RNA polymerase sigma-70 factor, ECF subfamily